MNKKAFAAITLIALLAPSAFAFAGTSSSTQSGTKHATMDFACVQTAVDAREGDIGSAFTAFSSAESAALSARKTALHDAWGQTTSAARKSARTKAWSDYKTANKAAYSALRTAKKAAWSTFATASASCKVPVVEGAAMEGEGSLGL